MSGINQLVLKESEGWCCAPPNRPEQMNAFTVEMAN